MLNMKPSYSLQTEVVCRMPCIFEAKIFSIEAECKGNNERDLMIWFIPLDPRNSEEAGHLMAVKYCPAVVTAQYAHVITWPALPFCLSMTR